jgi:anthranilate phosphoribosyltransferase
MMRAHLARVLDGATLTQAEMTECMAAVLSGAVPPAQVAALLGAMRVRGETVDELAGAVTAVRAVATRVVVEDEVVVDTCGTGGDQRGTFNISTAAAIVASSCGVTVAKHGNRSVSSRCGSADVLEALGVRLDLVPAELAHVISLTRLGFLFAPAHHPAFKHVAAVRRELGVRTLFNLVGPLANPANATRQVVGVFDPRFAPMMAQVLGRLGTTRALVVHGGGLDELSVCGPTTVHELRDGAVQAYEVTPAQLGLAVHAPASLDGGDASTNARIIMDVLGGQRGGPRDAVLANAAAALYVAGEVASLGEGVQRAARSLDSGAAEAHFERFLAVQAGQRTTLDDIVSKVRCVGAPASSARSPGSFRAALSARGGPTRVIAEVKRRSPSAGLIAEIPDPGALARRYVEHGAAAISVLTNEAHFGGSLADLRAVREAVQVPILRKDFIIDPRQLDEAVHAGADAVLLIAAVLGRGLGRMLALTRSLGLDALVEVHDEAELALALDVGADLVGVNNRDLRSFKVDLATTERLAARAVPGVLLVAESGIKSPQDVARLRACGVSNFLVGEFLVRGGVLS